MTTPRSGLRVLPVLALVLAALAGCELPAEDAAREITPFPGGTPQAPASPTVIASGDTVTETLCLVRDGMLVRVNRPLPLQPPLEDLLRHLLDGPTRAEQDSGLTSALLGSGVIAEVRLDGSQAAVVLAADLEGLTPTDVVLAFAQVVCTFSARPEVTGVYFLRGKERVSVPNGDGALSEGPLTLADYANLLKER